MIRVVSLAAALAFALAASSQALAACPGSVAAGLTISGGQTDTVYVRNSTGCVLLLPGASGSGITATPTGLVTIAVNSGAGAFVITPVAGANGTGTLTISYPGASPLNVPLTVNGVTLDLDTQ